MKNEKVGSAKAFPIFLRKVLRFPDFFVSLSAKIHLIINIINN